MNNQELGRMYKVVEDLINSRSKPDDASIEYKTLDGEVTIHTQGEWRSLIDAWKNGRKEDWVKGREE